MADTGLKVEVRDNLGKGAARKIRATGNIPGIVYGKGKKNITLSVNPTQLKKALVEGGGINTLLNLDLGSTKKTAIVKELQKHPIHKKYIHVDFYELDLAKRVTVEVPLHFEGKPEGIKEGGILQPIIRELKVTCLPNKIPANIEVNVASLNVGDALHISDLTLPEGVESAHESDEVLVNVAIPKEEVVEAPAAPAEGEEAAAAAEGEAPKEGEAPPAEGEAPKAEEGKAPEKGKKKEEKK